MSKNIIVNKISETCTIAVEPTHLEVKEEEYNAGPGWPTIKWKHFSQFFCDSSESIPGFFQGIWQNFMMFASKKNILLKYSYISWHYNCSGKSK